MRAHWWPWRRCHSLSANASRSLRKSFRISPGEPKPNTFPITEQDLMKELEDKVREFTENLPSSISDTIPLPSPTQTVALPPLADFDLELPLHDPEDIELHQLEPMPTNTTISSATTGPENDDLAALPTCSWNPSTSGSRVGDSPLSEGMNAEQQALARSVRPSDLGKTICEVCYKDFVYPARLLRHRRIHTGERPYKCEFCPKCFTQKIHLKLHTRTHTGEKPFKCSQCPYAASDMSSLKKHASKHVQKASPANP